MRAGRAPSPPPSRGRRTAAVRRRRASTSAPPRRATSRHRRWPSRWSRRRRRRARVPARRLVHASARTSGAPTLTRRPHVPALLIQCRNARDRSKGALRSPSATRPALYCGAWRRRTVKTAADIAARAVCMGVVSFRARFEGIRFAAGAGDDPDTDEMIAGVTSWLFDAGLAPALLATEAALLRLQAEQLGPGDPRGARRRAAARVDWRAARLPEPGRRSARPTTAATTPSRCCGCCRFVSDSPFVTRAGNVAGRRVGSDGDGRPSRARRRRRAPRRRRQPLVVARGQRIAGPPRQHRATQAHRHPARRRRQEPLVRHPVRRRRRRLRGLR